MNSRLKPAVLALLAEYNKLEQPTEMESKAFLFSIEMLIPSFRLVSAIATDCKHSGVTATVCMELVRLIFASRAEWADIHKAVFVIAKFIQQHSFSSIVSVEFVNWMACLDIKEDKPDWIEITGGKLPNLPMCKVKLSFDSKSLVSEIWGNKIDCFLENGKYRCTTEYLHKEVARDILGEYVSNFYFTHFAISYDI